VALRAGARGAFGASRDGPPRKVGVRRPDGPTTERPVETGS